jgi:hypothetical protein
MLLPVCNTIYFMKYDLNIFKKSNFNKNYRFKVLLFSLFPPFCFFVFNSSIALAATTCHTTNNISICHNTAEESVFFNTPSSEVAYNIQNIRRTSDYLTIFHGEPKGKNLGYPGDSLKFGVQIQINNLFCIQQMIQIRILVIVVGVIQCLFLGYQEIHINMCFIWE